MKMLYRAVIILFIIMPGEPISKLLGNFGNWLERMANKFDRWSQYFYHNIK